MRLHLAILTTPALSQHSLYGDCRVDVTVGEQKRHPYEKPVLPKYCSLNFLVKSVFIGPNCQQRQLVGKCRNLRGRYDASLAKILCQRECY